MLMTQRERLMEVCSRSYRDLVRLSVTNVIKHTLRYIIDANRSNIKRKKHDSMEKNETHKNAPKFEVLAYIKPF